MKTIIAIAGILGILIFSGCGAKPIVMKNPRTDQVVVCDGGARAREWPSGQWVADSCAEQLEKDGWIRVGGQAK
jgi:hypothetical protein